MISAEKALLLRKLINAGIKFEWKQTISLDAVLAIVSENELTELADDDHYIDITTRDVMPYPTLTRHGYNLVRDFERDHKKWVKEMLEAFTGGTGGANGQINTWSEKLSRCYEAVPYGDLISLRANLNDPFHPYDVLGVYSLSTELDELVEKMATLAPLHTWVGWDYAD